jgi:hypothetical protein
MPRHTTTDTATTTPATREFDEDVSIAALALALARHTRRSRGLTAWQCGIAALSLTAGVIVGTLASDHVNHTPTAPDPDTVTIDTIFEDGSGTFGTGDRTLTDGQVIHLTGQPFCLANYGCSG